MKQTYNHLNLPNGDLRISITNRCNMNCFYCHNEGQTKSYQPDMTFEQFLQIMDEAKKFGLRSITFTGGEPLLAKDFSKMLNWTVDNLESVDVCTNAILVPDFISELSDSKKINLTIGIDTCNVDKISKQSDCGEIFSTIAKNLKLLTQNETKFNINSVYSGINKKEIEEITEFCLSNKFDLRIIELDTYLFKNTGLTTPEFKSLIDHICNKFQLEVGYAHPGKGYFGMSKNNVKVNFYNAKCHTRDCANCAKCMFRIDSLGRAVPCYCRKERIDLLLDNPQEAYKNFLKAIYLLGLPPEKDLFLV